MEYIKIERVPGDYRISRCGSVINWNTGRILKTSNQNGYLGVTVKPNGRLGKSYRIKIHRELAIAWIPGYFDGAVVNHKDGNKINNDLENLEWVTSSENTLHAFRLGLTSVASGLDSPNMKLTKEQVIAVKNDPRSSRKVAKDYGVSKSTILHARKLDIVS